MASKNVPVRIQGLTGEAMNAEISLAIFGQRERMLRALKALAVCWTIAAVTVLIPVAHFVLVPLFLLAGPVAAYATYRRSVRVLGGSVPCANCKAVFQIGHGPAVWPLKEICPHCRSQIRLERAEQGT